MRDIYESKTCQYCGAPITAEICQYCGNPTGLDTERANMEYPVIECKEAILNFWNVIFPGIFAVAFGSVGVVMPMGMFLSRQGLFIIFFCIPFMLVAIGAGYVVIRNVSRYLKVKVHGKRITATVYGYVDDNLLINNAPAQVVKLLVQTADGPRFIMYQTGTTTQTYGVNTQLNLLVYKNYFMIVKREETIDWG